jgi:chaperonin GroEL (HSP60 family)
MSLKKMNEMVGDDTALAAILASAIYSKSVKYVVTGLKQ